MQPFILYACPVGALENQIETYFKVARSLCGPNPAHEYMPHCSLTGFFHDQLDQATSYAQVLDAICEQLAPEKSMPVVRITGTTFSDQFHGLELDAPWLLRLAAAFKSQAASGTRTDAIRPKTWLHVSFAYDFSPRQANQLKDLAQKLIDPESGCDWICRLYTRHDPNGWTCHWSYAI